jgi:hypothetical protein
MLRSARAGYCMAIFLRENNPLLHDADCAVKKATREQMRTLLASSINQPPGFRSPLSIAKPVSHGSILNEVDP